MKGQVYRCTNDRCRREIIESRSTDELCENPRCSCGSEMKKPYGKPLLRELSEAEAGRAKALFPKHRA